MELHWLKQVKEMIWYWRESWVLEESKGTLPRDPFKYIDPRSSSKCKFSGASHSFDRRCQGNQPCRFLGGPDTNKCVSWGPKTLLVWKGLKPSFLRITGIHERIWYNTVHSFRWDLVVSNRLKVDLENAKIWCTCSSRWYDMNKLLPITKLVQFQDSVLSWPW